ncbi:MAG: LysR family transcriptional regulator [Pseudomonadota bacterium]
MSLPHITWLRAFEAAARYNSFASAAKDLNLTSAAVSQQVRLLEKHLGVQLFRRLPRGVVLTDIGQAYAQPIRRSFSDLEKATDDLFRTKKKKTVKVRASISSATLVIAPLLADFHTRHPDVSVELSTFVWADRFDMENSDVDIRWGFGDSQEQSIQHLANESAVVVCNPASTPGKTDADGIRALAAQRIYQIVGREADWRDLSEYFNLELPMSEEIVSVDSSVLALMALTTAPGATIVLENFARHYVQTNQLVTPFGYRLPVAPAHYLVHRDGAQDRPEVAAFSAWIQQVYKEWSGV